MNRKDLYTHILTENNRSMLVYHGTPAQIDTLRPLSHLGSLKAAHNVEIKTDEENNLNNRNILSGYLVMSHPKKVLDLHIHDRMSYQGLVTLFLAEKSVDLNKIKDCTYLSLDNYLKPFYPTVWFIFKNPFEMDIKDVQTELELETLYPVAHESSSFHDADALNRDHLVYQRMIRFFESEGYDGLSYINQVEDKGHTSYITFRPNQFIQMDQLPAKPILFPSKENEALLEQIYLDTILTCPREMNLSTVEKKSFFQLLYETLDIQKLPRLKADYFTSRDQVLPLIRSSINKLNNKLREPNDSLNAQDIALGKLYSSIFADCWYIENILGQAMDPTYPTQLFHYLWLSSAYMQRIKPKDPVCLTKQLFQQIKNIGMGEVESIDDDGFYTTEYKPVSSDYINWEPALSNLFLYLVSQTKYSGAYNQLKKLDLSKRETYTVNCVLDTYNIPLKWQGKYDGPFETYTARKLAQLTPQERVNYLKSKQIDENLISLYVNLPQNTTKAQKIVSSQHHPLASKSMQQVLNNQHIHTAG